MEYIPIKTRVLLPPKDDLFAVLDTFLTDLQEGDVLVVTSKVVSIHLGLCIPEAEVDKEKLTQTEADYYMLRPSGATFPLTIKHHALLYRSGIDESNSGGYYTVLPPKPYESAQAIRAHLLKKHGLKNLGVIISDSMVLPFRKGLVGTSIGVAGFVPYRTHGPEDVDLFGQAMIETSTNLADAIAAGSSVVSGEGAECTPLVVVRGVSDISFSEVNIEADYLMDPKRDLFQPLLQKYLE